jgi:hypothetical protein
LIGLRPKKELYIYGYKDNRAGNVTLYMILRASNLKEV